MVNILRNLRRPRGPAARGKGGFWAKSPTVQSRRNWTFETLEVRHFLSATIGDLQTTSISSDTLEGMQQIIQRELDWAFKQTASVARANGGFENATQWIVRTAPGTSVNDIAQQTGLSVERLYGNLPDTFVLSSAGIDPSQVDVGLKAQDGIVAYFPARQETRLAPTSIPTDSLFGSQWHLLNTGQVVGSPNFQEIRGVPGEDINVLPVWEQLGFTGKGIVVGVVDSGVELKHPDLINNIHPTARTDLIGLDSNPNPDGTTAGNAHGTAVAGLIAAGNNGFGTVGVAYDAQIAPIRLIPPGDGPVNFSGFLTGDERTARAFGFENQVVDVYNHSWGPGDGARTVDPVGPLSIQALRDSVFFGRGGLGNIHVFATGNDAGPVTSPGFSTLGFWDSARYNGYTNSRYTIAVSGVDHDGQVSNVDGTVTTYPEAGPAVLVAAPTGSFPVDLGNDFLVGSGLWTTDLTGDKGINREPLDSGQEIDNDFLADINYTSRFNGTSAAAPLVSGVVALMLEANPFLSYRDVQEILVRSARQNVPDEAAITGGGTGLEGAAQNGNAWVTNRVAFFRDPFPYDPDVPPLFQIFDPPLAPREAQLFTNGAGYTVSDGRGPFSDEHGYGHGVVDAELAVRMAQQWHLNDQDLPPELTFTTFVDIADIGILSVEVGNDDSGNFRVPGAFNNPDGQGFIDFFNEYFVEDDPDDPDDGPFSGDDPPINTRGLPFLEFSPPVDQLMSVEWVEIKMDISGDANAYDLLRFSLESPSGTVTELNNYFLNNGGGGFYQADTIGIPLDTDPPGTLDDDGFLSWTWSTNRHWGERSDSLPAINPATGEPRLATFDPMTFALIPTADPSMNASLYDGTSGGFGLLGTGDKNWRLHVENYSDSQFTMEALEIVWHGRRLTQNTRRIQGVVGIDTGTANNPQDGDFNFERYNQFVIDPDAAAVSRSEDPDPEPFAANVTVELLAEVDGALTLIDQFVTGADGNFYFDVEPGKYKIRVRDATGAPLTTLTEQEVPEGQMPYFQAEWDITEDWFFYSDRAEWDPAEAHALRRLVDPENPDVPLRFQYSPDDGTTLLDVPGNVTGVNFLIDPGPPPEPFIFVEGSVFADLDGDGIKDAVDPPVGNVTIYVDTNLSGKFDVGDQTTKTDSNGNYSIDVPANEARRFRLGVNPPNAGWTFTNPAKGVHEVFAQRGDVVTAGTDFFLRPPSGPNAPGVVPGTPGSVLGFVFNDANQNQRQDFGEGGLGGVTIYLDLDENGELNRDANDVPTEPFKVTFDTGAFFFSGVAPGTYQVGIEAPAPLMVTVPVPPNQFIQITMESGGMVSGVSFGLFNPLTLDFGDLPAPFPTLLFDEQDQFIDGPRHTVVPGFQLGPFVDMELDGQPTDAGFPMGDNTIGVDEDGVVLLNSLGEPGGSLREGTNVLRIEVNGVGGHLHGWMDLNGNQAFDPGEKIINGVALHPGIHHFQVNIAPGTLPVGPVAARFRWSEMEILGITGHGLRGEVEDYLFPTVNPGPAVVEPTLPGDYNADRVVDEADYDTWRAQLGQQVAPGTGADGSGDGRVNLADYTVWRNNLGQVAASASVVVPTYNQRFAVQAYAAAAALQNRRSLEIGLSPETIAQFESFGTQYVVAASDSPFALNSIPTRAGAESNGSTSDSSAEESDDAAGRQTARRLSSFAVSPRRAARLEAFTTSEMDATVPAAASQELLDLVLSEFRPPSRGLLDEEYEASVRPQEDEPNLAELTLSAALRDESQWRFPRARFR